VGKPKSVWLVLLQDRSNWYASFQLKMSKVMANGLVRVRILKCNIYVGAWMAANYVGTGLPISVIFLWQCVYGLCKVLQSPKLECSDFSA